MLLGCTASTDAPEALFQPDASGFFDAPWPSDARVDADGVADWADFPNPESIELLDTFLAVGTQTEGFGHNSPIYFRVPGGMDETLLPDPEDSTEPTSALQLINVDPRSPAWGERIPLRWESWTQDGSYSAEGLYAVGPLPGFPLRPRTTYALVVSTEVASASTAFEEAWDADSAWGRALSPLRQSLSFLGLSKDDIGIATTFTTGDPLAEMESIARFLHERVDPPTFQRDLEERYQLGTYEVYRTNYTTPVFMHGERPYDDAGGEFQTRDDGLPSIASWDPMRMSVVLPETREAPPPGGWPVMIYLHGTGGNYRTFCNSDRDLEVANWLAPLGVVGIGIDLPLHGPRGTDDTLIDLHSFNVLQPESALHIHRQAAADLLYLLQGLATQQVLFNTPDGEEVVLDPNRIMVMGHSQGALTASLALPWAGSWLQGAVLSGGGGLLAITAVERDADFDFPELIRGLLEFDDGEQVTEMHPALGLVQALVEPTDPINYARYWFREDGGFTNARPTPVLVMSGIRDDQTPYRTAEALATAAGVPFVGERFAKAQGMLLAGLDSQSFPVEGNLQAWDGSQVTGGLSQWADGTHFVVFEEESARDLVRNFVDSTLHDEGSVIRPGLPTDRP